MARATSIQGAFNSGELSPRMYGRIDIAQYKNGLGECTNAIPLIQGGLTKRPGTGFIAEVKDSTQKTRVLPFVFGTTQSYVLEFGNLYVRFYMNDGQIQVAGVPVELITPYTTADLPLLRIVQNADILWVMHPNHKPQEITRTSHTTWTIQDYVTTDGPYQDIQPDLLNIMTPSGTTSGININTTTAAFVSTDVGRLIRFRDSALNWTWMEIINYVSATFVQVTVKGADLATNAPSNAWRLGAWSDTTGYPSVGSFHENRLVMAGTTTEPFVVDASNSGEYWNYAPTLPDGTVTDAHSYRFPLLANEVNSITWIDSDERGMLIGTVGAEWIVAASLTSAALSPTNLKIIRLGNRGSYAVAGLKVGKAVLFLQRSRKKVRELAYTFNVDGFVAPDLNQLSDMITGTGITELYYQQEPVSVVWSVRDDGRLVGFVYDKNEQAVGWHTHVTDGLIESICVIPNDENLFDELYLIVNRTINGVTKRYIEDLDSYWAFQTDAVIADALYSDSALRYSGASTTVITGLTHLEGKTVNVLGDGIAQAQKVVTGGQITLDTAVTKAVIGLPYTAAIETLRQVGGSQNGTAQSKTKRTNRVAVRVNNSQNISIGPDTNNMEKITQTGLFSGDIEKVWPQGYDGDDIIRIEHDDPYPLDISAIINYFEVYDR